MSRLQALLVLLVCAAVAKASPVQPPNVVLIVTDDQGYGDLGFNGNPVIRTPNLDRFARESVVLNRFHVSPVCSPTRASLMTGRYNYRTGVVDTFLGRSLMYSEEVTLAEMLAAAGYRTGIFGKWHLGDNYPLRPVDQGFQEALVHRGGGIGQPADPPGNTYFDPILQDNGQPKKTKGYCSDIFADAAMRFIEKNRDNRFLAYLAFNCPHDPLQVPSRYHEMYRTLDLGPAAFPAAGRPAASNPDATAKIYGMVTNIDDNVGRLLAKLGELKLAENTIVIFMTDNGPQIPRYNAGMRGQKGTVYDGGIRVPCFIRWPRKLKAGTKVEPIAAHIDIAPTLLAACGVPKPPEARFDGVSLLPLLTNQATGWPDRTLYFQWHRGDEPKLYHSFAARSARWKLLQPAANMLTADPRFELYDMQADPFEKRDLAGQHPQIVQSMREGYEAWFNDVSRTRGYAPPRIHLGTPHQNLVTLTRQDWRGPHATWLGPKGDGYWEVDVADAGAYIIHLRFDPLPVAGKAHFSMSGVNAEQQVAAGAKECKFAPIHLPAGPGRLRAWLSSANEKAGVWQIDVRRLGLAE